MEEKLHKLHIKNMVCQRCIKVVKEVFMQLAIPVATIELGVVVVKATEKEIPMQKLRDVLESEGFELLDDKRSKLIDQVKQVIIQQVHRNAGEENHKNLSDILEERLHMEYSYLSHLFSQTEGITIEKYTILQRIEKAKELLVYDEFTLSEIAWQLQYSSVQHLSSQFKKVTGMTPGAFKKLNQPRRKPIDKVGE
ncbi:MAG: helix-turn-helix transcriptional regulator [Cyclobacteriaceae bacterium]|nr:helix-turn-helix transcriptional regulator [Cyclobacteriaceae bacterium]